MLRKPQTPTRVSTQANDRSRWNEEYPPPPTPVMPEIRPGIPARQHGCHERRLMGSALVSKPRVPRRAHHLERRQQQQHANYRLINRCRQVDGPAEQGKRRAQYGKRIAASPRQPTGAVESGTTDGRHQNIERKRSGLDDIGGETHQPHDGNIAGTASLSHRSVQDRNQSEDGQKQALQKCLIQKGCGGCSRQ